MPEISRFYGIIIAMFYEDHPPPHFHARYGDQQATIGIQNLAVFEGFLPPRALGLVMEWAAQHTEALAANWEAAKKNLPLKKIEPLG